MGTFKTNDRVSIHVSKCSAALGKNREEVSVPVQTAIRMRG